MTGATFIYVHTIIVKLLSSTGLPCLTLTIIYIARRGPRVSSWAPYARAWVLEGGHIYLYAWARDKTARDSRVKRLPIIDSMFYMLCVGERARLDPNKTSPAHIPSILAGCKLRPFTSINIWKVSINTIPRLTLLLRRNISFS